MSSRVAGSMSRRSGSPIDHHTRFHQRHRSPIDRYHSSSHRSPRLKHPNPAKLPGNAPQISKHDFKVYRSMFALYLEVQKQLDIEVLTEHEARGRWKSFVGKWYDEFYCTMVLAMAKELRLTLVRNRGELAEGWYDPKMYEKAEAFVAGSASAAKTPQYRALSPRHQPPHRVESSDEDELGPALPTAPRGGTRRNNRSGPTIPNLQDLELQQGVPSTFAWSFKFKLSSLNQNSPTRISSITVKTYEASVG